MVKSFVMIALFVLSGCVSTRQSVMTDPRQVWCDQNTPRRDATIETPRSVLDEINAHNRKGVLWCGWGLVK